MLVTDGYTVEICFEALEPLQEPLIWKLVYVGEAHTEQYDQVLEDIEMPIQQAGSMKFNILVSLLNNFRLIHQTSLKFLQMKLLESRQYC